MDPKRSLLLTVVVSVAVTLGVACAKPNANTPSSVTGSSTSSAAPAGSTVETGTFSLSCGANTGGLDFQTTIPARWNGNQFAILLSGTPGTNYVSEYHRTMLRALDESDDPRAEGARFALGNIEDQFQSLLNGLLNQGYKVLEVKYHSNPRPCLSNTPNVPALSTADGFYSLCCRQGLNQVEAHNAALYDAAVQRLGYSPTNSQHRLIGFGISQGGTQVESMAFITGKKFEKVGIAGVLMGDSARGCRDGQDRSRFNGMGWQDFMGFANALTTTGQGCSTRGDLEYTRNHDFRNFAHRTRWDLALFEGQQREHLAPGSNLADPVGLHALDLQAEYIRTARSMDVQNARGDRFSAAPAATTLHLYPSCRHDVIFCSRGEATRDILAYFDPARTGLDSASPAAP